jgi:hypothetical protein
MAYTAYIAPTSCVTVPGSHACMLLCYSFRYICTCPPLYQTRHTGPWFELQSPSGKGSWVGFRTRSHRSPQPSLGTSPSPNLQIASLRLVRASPSY